MQELAARVSKDLAALRAEVETDQVSTKNAVEAHVAYDEETIAARKELQLVAGKLALRAVALKAVASKLGGAANGVEGSRRR